MEAIIDYRGKTPVKVSRGIPLITAKIVKNGVIEAPTEYVAEADYDAWMRRGLPMTGDVLLTTEAPLGEVAQLQTEKVALAQRIILLRGKRGELDNTFLRFLLQSDQVRNQLVSRSSGTTVSGIKQSELRKVLLPLPPYSEQQRIGGLLGALSDAIQVRKSCNNNLEAISQGIFKSWFVDFDPVRAKAEGREPEGMDAATAALFPDEFEERDSIGIPSGWSLSSVGDLCRRISMGPFGSDIKTDNFQEQGVPIIRGKNLGNGFIDDDFVYLSEQKANQLRAANAFGGDIVITHRGTLGQVGLIPLESRFPRYVVSQSQMVLSVLPDKATPAFLYYYLISSEGQHRLLANTSQTGVPAISRPTTSVRAMQILLPDSIRIIEAFDDTVRPLMRKNSANVSLLRTLVELRDTLLPRLISGKLRIPEAEKLVEAVL
jgi:type I restriction enzyme S subunit